MRYSICVIDNEIPATGVETISDTDLLNSSNLQYLLKQTNKPWVDDVIKNLIQTLLAETNSDGTPKWDVYAFTHPSLYINMLNYGTLRFDIVIFDWEYPGTGSQTDSESLLKEILSNSFSLIFIFSKPDKETEIQAIMDKVEFAEYKNRLYYQNKTVSGTDQTSALLTAATTMYDTNFSFKFGGDLRKKSIQIMDKILSQLGRATLNDIRNYLNLDEHGEKRDLIDFLAERFKAGLVVANVPSLGGGASSTTPVDRALVKTIWAHRLYLPLDDNLTRGEELVRRGDIVKLSGEYFLVISADCDLKRFWHKNFGSISLLPMHHLHNSNTALKELLTFCVSPADLRTGEFKHLTDKIGKLSEGPFILPFLLIEGEYKSFVVLPKEFTGKQVTLPTAVTAFSKEKRKDSQLKYEWWNGADKICSISEPFLTAIVQHTFNVIGGYGVPDYPHPVMKQIFSEILNNFITVSTTS